MNGDNIIGPYDVLLGRGGVTNANPGNLCFRNIVADHQNEYLVARKKEKVLIARRIVAIVKQNGGRFLQKTDASVESWVQVSEKRAIEKAAQALREGIDARNKTIRPNKQIRYRLNTNYHGRSHSDANEKRQSSPDSQSSPALVSLSGRDNANTMQNVEEEFPRAFRQFQQPVITQVKNVWEL